MESSVVLINNKVYFNGGWNRSYVDSFFYLDVSKPFTTSDVASMPWTDLSSITGRINRTGSTACGTNNNQIFYFGGGEVDNFTAIFDITAQQWSIPKMSENFIVERKFTQCVVSGDRMYIYGGYENLFSMVKLDVLNLAWSIFYPGLMAPIGLFGNGAILLNNTHILYIGGNSVRYGATISYLLLDKLPMYNIDDNTWSIVPTSGNIPSARYHHGTVFIPQYNQILIFYGYPIPDNSIMALDTLKFVWSIPTISNIGGSQNNLNRFNSILIGTYILIAFGISDNDYTNNMFLLDVSQKDSYKWVTSYDPTKSTSTTSTPTPSTSVYSPTTSTTSTTPFTSTTPINFGAIIGGTIGGIAGLIILSTVAFITIKRYGHSPNFFTSQEEESNQQIS
ncbi:9470_t:CDS:2 [Diversispora eburnea]|uniref:9470_t:CDS:1 n=1 Tax=Diversispora eburnea TaxID=1213867 RepID=A0A9N9FGJ1_9GLOM|nr:9470_t:CDS:2 [Diversispora eburnea]